VDAKAIQQKKFEIAQRYGAWTSHNIQLHDELYTMGPKIEDDQLRLRRVVQIISNVLRRPFDQLRVLDLACLEGLFAVEFARRGAEVVGIEGREANIEKARFAKVVLSLNNLELVQDDVRNLSRERYGGFNVVLALGILYHLDVPDIFAFLERLYEVCDDICIIDTHVTEPEAAPETYMYNGRHYRGVSYAEFDPSQNGRWDSLSNRKSAILTRNSLFNALAHVGFSSAFECRIPPVPEWGGWGTFVAIKGQRESLVSAPLPDGQPWSDLPEVAIRPGLVMALKRAIKKIIFRSGALQPR
jgi:SAM-dependent methyltransferase